MSRVHVSTTVNGDAVEYLCEADETLLDVLRDRLGLTGAKEGCGTGDCGACSVTAVDGRSSAPACAGRRGGGARKSAVEGIANGDKLHPLQKSSWSMPPCNAVSVPGFLVAAKALLDHNPNPTETRSASGWPATLPLHWL
jgi:carbon-monoxide dehydrogenase small subunit